MPRELVSELLKRGSSVWNMYGSTETTFCSAVAQVASANDLITLGRPIANTQFYVLDFHLQPVPVGVPGELYVGGDGLAWGYLHHPVLTARKFIPNPFAEPGSQARLYRTGDLASYRPNGEIECLGRIDRQVKVRGFRIELGEPDIINQGEEATSKEAIERRLLEISKKLWSLMRPSLPGKSAPGVRQQTEYRRSS